MSIALVTGSSTGIGLATAVTLARAGHKVFATMRNPAIGGEEIKRIAGAENLPIEVLPLDVDSDDSVRDTIAKVGPLDVLVNNAGVGVFGSVEELPIHEFRRVFETNFFGALRCIQAVLPGMRERRRGLIVNITSVAGRVAGGAQAAYSGSKWALEALSESLASEVKAFGIRVAIVEPGVIATPIFGKQSSGRSAIYPHQKRLDALFAARLKENVSPYVVGEVILGIVDSDSWQLRYPAGPDAAQILGMRAHISDEQWVAAGAASDEEWKESMKRGMGLDVEL
jgi:NAD(P)-dependent dehydrogenase (short-subunit alcohol dehydrogenase family)